MGWVGSMKLRISILAATAVCLSLALEQSAFAGPTSAEIRCEDVLGREGRLVKLKAKLERTGVLGINPDVVEEALDFYLVRSEGRELSKEVFLGTAETNDDGVAEIEWRPEKAGAYGIQARIRRGSEYVGLPGTLHVAVPPPNRTVILMQLDATVSEATNLQMWRGKDIQEIAAIEGARLNLEALGRHYQLVYLTKLDASFTRKFKDWLELRQMPPAPVVFWDLFEKSLSHSTYMDKLVEKLRQDLPQATIGVGGEISDAEAFLKHGMAAIVLARRSSLDEDDWREEMIHASRWERVLGHVVQLHRTSGLLGKLVGEDPEKSAAALSELSLLGDAGVGYVYRYRRSSDVNMATAASQVAGRLRASRAFFETLDLSTANRGLSSLLAAWREGDPAVVARLHRAPEAALEQLPRFQRCELVSRNQAEPGRVVFRVRLVTAAGEASEREVVMVESDGGWRVDRPD